MNLCVCRLGLVISDIFIQKYTQNILHFVDIDVTSSYKLLEIFNLDKSAEVRE